MEKQIIHVYHHDDLDGIAAASIIDLAFPTATKTFFSKTYPVNIDASLYQFTGGAANITIYMVDLSLTEDHIPMLEKLSKTGCEVIWIDHHKSSLRIYNKVPRGIKVKLDSSRCGAYLTHEYLHPGREIPVYINLVDIYDRHVMEHLEIGTEFNYGMMTFPHLEPTSAVWRNLLKNDKAEISMIRGRGRIILEYLRLSNSEFVRKNSVITSLCGVECICVNAVGTSILFDSVEDKFPLCVAWYHTGSLYKYSIYSSSDTIDCSKIAETFGGGGHKGAAGFTSEKLVVPKNVTPN